MLTTIFLSCFINSVIYPFLTYGVHVWGLTSLISNTIIHYPEKAIRITSFSEHNLILSLCSNLSTYLSSMMSLNHRYSLLFISGHASLRASSPIWASETSLGRTRKRATKPQGAEKRRACTIAYKFSFVLCPGEGKYHWLKNDVPKIKVD